MPVRVRAGTGSARRAPGPLWDKQYIQYSTRLWAYLLNPEVLSKSHKESVLGLFWDPTGQEISFTPPDF